MIEAILKVKIGNFSYIDNLILKLMDFIYEIKACELWSTVKIYKIIVITIYFVKKVLSGKIRDFFQIKITKEVQLLGKAGEKFEECAGSIRAY